MNKVFETTGPVSLEIHVPAGRVELATSETATTEIDVAPLSDNDVSRRAVDGCRVDMRTEGERSLVRVDVPRRGFAFPSKEPEVLVTVRSPEGTDVDATLSSADIEGSGLFGSLRIKSASGDVSFDSVGAVDLKTASGDVRLEDIGGTAKIQSASGDVEINSVDAATKIHSASGDVNVNRASDDIKVQTASGDLRIGAVVSGQVSLQSASGDITIGVARGSTLWVDAKSLSGDTTSELDVGDEPPDIDGPHVDLRATAMSGDIHIARADALT